MSMSAHLALDSALASALILAGVADGGEVDVDLLQHSASHVGQDDVLISRPVLATPAGRDALGIGIEHGDSDLASRGATCLLARRDTDTSRCGLTHRDA
jgi:hypothetical protein